jgi:hypothetical protein
MKPLSGQCQYAIAVFNKASAEYDRAEKELCKFMQKEITRAKRCKDPVTALTGLVAKWPACASRRFIHEAIYKLQHKEGKK